MYVNDWLGLIDAIIDFIEKLASIGWQLGLAILLWSVIIWGM